MEMPDRKGGGVSKGARNIPVSVAKGIAEDFQKSQVIIIAFDPVSSLIHVATYGKEPFDKENAAAAGEICTKALGGDLSKKQTFEDYHSDYDAATFKASIELFKLLIGRNDGSPWATQQMEKILKAAGQPLRQA